MDVVKHVEKGYKMEAPEGCPPEVYEIMRQVVNIVYLYVILVIEMRFLFFLFLGMGFES